MTRGEERLKLRISMVASRWYWNGQGDRLLSDITPICMSNAEMYKRKIYGGIKSRQKHQRRSHESSSSQIGC